MARSATATTRLLGRWLGLLLVGALMSPTLFGHATKPMPRVSITGKVLLGDPKSFRTVQVAGTVSPGSVSGNSITSGLTVTPWTRAVSRSCVPPRTPSIRPCC